jgi:hypothetical protein
MASPVQPRSGAGIVRMGKEYDVRKLLTVAAMTLALMGLAGSALASTTIQWTGQGGENLPCANGGHWVLTGKGITSATMTVANRTYVMTQNGNGSFAADSDKPISASTVASATYEGTVANGNPQFVLSHCTDGGGGYPGY